MQCSEAGHSKCRVPQPRTELRSPAAQAGPAAIPRKDTMSAEQYCQDWRQIRLFSGDSSRLWYPSLLQRILSPLFSDYPGPLLFFSQYVCPRDGQAADNGDTDINQLPDAFLHPSPAGYLHKSVRIRMKGDAVEQNLAQRLDAAPPDEFWHDAVRDYDLLDDLGGPRFSPDVALARRQERGRLIAEALRANARCVIDAIRQDPDGAPRFEANDHEENSRLSSTFQSLGHMYHQVWVDRDGWPLPVVAVPRAYLPGEWYNNLRL